MGFCPCCVLATHVAIPDSYLLGPYGERKHVGLRLWTQEGPRAARRLAAINYVLNSNGRIPPPPAWDWAARSLEFQAAGPFNRGFFRGAPMCTPAIAQANAQPPAEREPEKVPQKELPEPPH